MNYKWLWLCYQLDYSVLVSNVFCEDARLA